MTTQSYVLVDINTKNGKKFKNKTETFIQSLCDTSQFNDKTRFVKLLTEEQLRSNSYLTKIFDNMQNNGDAELKSLFQSLTLKNVTVGLFGRTGGFTHRAIAGHYFRFFVHFGDPELYYSDSENVENHGISMKSGYSFVLDPTQANSTTITVYENKLRNAFDVKVDPDIPRIRSPDYRRFTLIYDYEFLMKDECPTSCTEDHTHNHADTSELVDTLNTDTLNTDTLNTDTLNTAELVDTLNTDTLNTTELVDTLNTDTLNIPELVDTPNTL